MGVKLPIHPSTFALVLLTELFFVPDRSLSTPEKMQQLQADLVDNIVISAADFEHALNRIHPSCSQEDISRHEEFWKTYGSA